MSHTISLVLALNDYPEGWTPKKVFIHWLESAVSKRHAELAASEMRKYLTALGKVEHAFDTEGDEVEFEDSEYEFFRDAFLKAKFPPQNGNVVSMFYDKFGI